MVRKKHLFSSPRLGFRNWLPEDMTKMVAISSNESVMRHFPAVAKPEETLSFLKRMQALFEEKKYCYFAVDLIETNEFIGFIGLNDINYEAPFSPAVDIGWRLGKEYWGYGYATEGAKQCLNYGFKTLGLTSIVAIAPIVNDTSIAVMKKIGMTEKLNFKHPKLTEYPNLVDCVCFEIRDA